jgi:ferredoxin
MTEEPMTVDDLLQRWVKVIDQDKCIGCHACTTACKSENEVPLGVTRTYVKSVEVAVFPQVRRAFRVTRCNQCADAPCTTACPKQAMYRRPDGIVARGETFYQDASRVHLAAFPPRERWDDWVELSSRAWPAREEHHYMLMPAGADAVVRVEWTDGGTERVANGRPVSAFVSFRLFVIPAVNAMRGLGPDEPRRAVLTAPPTPLTSPAARRSFICGVLDHQRGTVSPAPGRSTHQLTALARSNALIIVPEQVTALAGGDAVEVLELQP